jgi:hypothetical protein
MQNEKRWRQADETDDFYCCNGHLEKNIYYARTYTPGKGFGFSETNQLIANFQMGKKAPSNRIGYRNGSIDTFSQEVTDFLTSKKRSDENFLIIPMPCSKQRSHKDYDDRIDLVAQGIAKQCQNVEYFPILEGDKMPAFHESKKPRNWKSVYDSLRINEDLRRKHKSGKILTLLDDVTTSGAHFEGARVLLHETFPENEIWGLFWAKSKSQPPEPL